LRIDESWTKHRKVNAIRAIVQNLAKIEIDWNKHTRKIYEALDSSELPSFAHFSYKILTIYGLTWSDLTDPDILDEKSENAVGDYIDFIYKCFRDRTVDLLEPIIFAVRQIASVANIDNLISDEAIVLFMQQYFAENGTSDINQTGLSTQLIAFLKQNKPETTETKTAPSVEDVRQFLKRAETDQSNSDSGIKTTVGYIDRIQQFDQLLNIQEQTRRSELSALGLAQYLLFDILSQICNTTFEFNGYQSRITDIHAQIISYNDTNPDSQIAKILVDRIKQIIGIESLGLTHLNKFIAGYQNDSLEANLARKQIDPKKLISEREILDPTVKQLLVTFLMIEGSELQTNITELKYPYFFDFSDCGTGKTFTMISQIIAAPETLHFLLVPNPNLHGITEQVNKYTSDADTEVINIHKLDAEKFLEIQKSFKENSKKKFVIIGTYHDISNLETDEAEQIANLSCQIPFRVMCDESHNIKTQGSKRWQNLNYILNRGQCKGWYNATATPVTVEAEDLIRQIEISTGLDINNLVNPTGSKVSQVDQMLWLRRYLIENNATLSQHVLPETLKLPKIEHQKPQIIIDLLTKKGQEALIKLNRSFRGGGLFDGSRTEIIKILSALKLNPEEFDLEYEGRSESFGDVIQKAKEEGRKMVIYTHSIAHGDIIHEISKVLMELKDEQGQYLLEAKDISYFTAQNVDTDRFTELGNFIDETGFKILISTRVIGASIDGLQGKEGIENSSVKLVWVSNGTSTHASQHQLEGRFSRLGGPKLKTLDEGKESTVKFITPQVVFRNGEKELSLERLLETVRDYRGGLLKVLFEGSLNQVVSAPDEDSLIRLFVNDLFDMVSDQQFKQILELDPEAISNPLSRLKYRADQEFIQTQHQCFALGHDLTQQDISFEDWTRYHKIRQRLEESWITLPRITTRNILLQRLQRSPKENNPVNILEIGSGTTPVLGGLRLKQKVELKPIIYNNIDIHRGFEPEPSKEQIQLKLSQEIRNLELLKHEANSPREELNIQKEIKSLKADLEALTQIDFAIDFTAGDYRYSEALPYNNDYIISCLSLYTWKEGPLLDLLVKLTEKLKTGGEIVFIFSKSDLEKVNSETNLTRCEMLKTVLESLGMTSSNFFEEQRYNFNNLDSFKLFPGSTFVGASFTK